MSFIKYGASIRSYALAQKGQRHDAPEVLIYYGKTGTGKTSHTWEEFPDAYNVPMPRTGGWWWPLYAGQETIIIDEFAHQFKFHTMLSIIDRYPFDIQEKGANSNFCSKRIIITSNIDPMNWYPGVDWEKRGARIPY